MVYVHFFYSLDNWLISIGNNCLRSSFIHEGLASLKPLHEVGALVDTVLLLVESGDAVVLGVVSFDDEALLAP